MVAKRIIPCLDIDRARVVKGTKFLDLKDMGDPVSLALRYVDEGADELVFLDITASNEKRETLYKLVRDVAEVLTIPFTVGGGISSADEASKVFDCGADKISINTSAVKEPSIISECAKRFGSQAVVVAVDTRVVNGTDKVFTRGGREETKNLTTVWVVKAYEAGAGEILLTSMDHDGVREGFANDLIHKVSSSVPIPLIASGGAGKEDDFVSVFKDGKADAALAAGIFHERKIAISSIKKRLAKEGIEVRI